MSVESLYPGERNGNFTKVKLKAERKRFGNLIRRNFQIAMERDKFMGRDFQIFMADSYLNKVDAFIFLKSDST